jgi:hypothetical protein
VHTGEKALVILADSALFMPEAERVDDQLESPGPALWSSRDRENKPLVSKQPAKIPLKLEGIFHILKTGSIISLKIGYDTDRTI